MLRLLLLRHAKSAWSSTDIADFERPLAPRGEREAVALASVLRQKSIAPDLVLCSTALRTRQTLAFLLPELSGTCTVRLERRLYEAGDSDYAGLIRELGGEAGQVMVIGHNPAIQATALRLTGDKDTGLRLRLAAKFPTSGLADISFAVENWAQITHGGGRLDDFFKIAADSE